MSSKHLPAGLSSVFADFAHWLDKRTAARVPVLLFGILFACGRRTVTSWLHAADITTEFRPAYHAVHVIGRHSRELALTAWHTATPCLATSRRLLVGIDDSPTKRYGPEVQGAGIHHNPTPGPADNKFLYGHVWVSLAALAHHPTRGTIALPLLADLYVRQKNLPKVPPEYKWQFRTKLEMAADQLRWLAPWTHAFDEVVAVIDGGYAKKPFIKPAKEAGVEVIGRMRKDSAVRSVPPPRKEGQRGRTRIYGAERLSLAKRAGQKRGWQTVECMQYGVKVIKTYKTFQATWRPAGGLIRVVLVKEEEDWLPLFSTNPEATVVQILEAVADRGAHEQTFKDVKEVWGAGEQQVRDVYANVGAFNLCCWMYTTVEAWAWEKPDFEVVDRSKSPWDDPDRRASHADKRKALQIQVLRAEIDEALSGTPTPERIHDLAERLLALAA